MDTESLKLIGELSIPMETTCIRVARMGSILVRRIPWKQHKEAHQVTLHMEAFPPPMFT